MGGGCVVWWEVARRRAAGAQRARSSTPDERSRSEGVATEAAWPRSKTADGGRPGTETEMGTKAGTGTDADAV